jgi:hypothetical protein
MKGIIYLIVVVCTTVFSSHAQQRIEPNLMNYIIGPKPNNIIYHDTLYKGSRQFMQLFYRTHNPELIHYYQKHQSNKIAGQVISLMGTVATIVGISRVSSMSSGYDKGTSWAIVGGGFAATLTGGYLIFMGQRNLQMAVTLFNQQYNKTAWGIGVSGNHAGLVYKF